MGGVGTCSRKFKELGPERLGSGADLTHALVHSTNTECIDDHVDELLGEKTAGSKVNTAPLHPHFGSLKSNARSKQAKRPLQHCVRRCGWGVSEIHCGGYGEALTPVAVVCV